MPNSKVRHWCNTLFGHIQLKHLLILLKKSLFRRLSSILCQNKGLRISCNILEKEVIQMFLCGAGIAIVVVAILMLIALGVVF